MEHTEDDHRALRRQNSSQADRRNPWRWLGWIFLTLVTVILAAALGLWVALESPGFRRAVLDRLDLSLGEPPGLTLSVDDFSLLPRGPALELRGVSLATPGRDPLITVGSANVEVSLVSLLSGPTTLKRVLLDGVHIDLAQPLPQFASREEATPSAPEIEVLELALEDGSLEGIAIPESVSGWIESASVHDIEIRGSLQQGLLDLRLVDALGTWSRTDQQMVTLRGSGRVEGPLSGPWKISELDLSGDGLDVEASGLFGLKPEQPLSVNLDLAAQPHRLLPLPTDESELQLALEADLRRRQGSVELEVVDLPAEVARPWLGEAFLPDLDATGSSISIDADLGLGRVGDEVWDGSAHLTWDRPDETLIELDLGIPTTVAAGSTLQVEMAARGLPSLPGQRHASALLTILDWADSDTISVANGRIVVDLPDVGTALRDLRSRWPGLPELPAATDLRGPLAFEARFWGPLAALEAELEGDWQPVPGTRLHLAASGDPLSLSGRAALTLDPLPLDLLAFDALGVVAGDALFEGSLSSYQWRAEIQAENLGSSTTEVRLDELRADLRGDNQRVTLVSLQTIVGSRVLTLEGSLDLARPISDARFRGQVTNPLPGISESTLALILGDGKLEINAEPRLAGETSGKVHATLPLATLDTVPALAGSLANLPVQQAGGPFELDWDLPVVDWSPLVAGLVAGGRGALQLGSLDLASLSGEIELRGRVTLEAVKPYLEVEDADGELAIELALAGTPGAPTGHLEIRGPGSRLALAGPPCIVVENLLLEAVLEGRRLQVSTLEMGFNQGRLALHGELDWETGSPQVRAQLMVDRALPPLDRAELQIGFADGLLTITSSDLQLAGVTGEVAASASAATLSRLTGREIPLNWLSEGPPEGPIRLRWTIPETDWIPLLQRLEIEELPEVLRAGSTAALEIDPLRPAASTGTIELSGLVLEREGIRVTAPEPVRLRSVVGRWTLEPTTLVSADDTLELRAAAEVNPEWQPGQSLAELVRDTELDVRGDLEAMLLNPFLSGGSGRGQLHLEASASGPLSNLIGEIAITGPDASFFFSSPYAVKIESPELELEVVESTLYLRSGRVRVNEGTVELTGQANTETGFSLQAALSDLRLRLDYGLLALVSGDLDLSVPTDGMGRLSGDLVVDQGSLTRPIEIDLQFLTQLLAPADLTGSEESFLERIALDLDLRTRQGVQVKNNVADLEVRWDVIGISGTALEPVLSGQLDITPGGRVYLFGQTVRVDQGAIIYPGQPGVEAILELETTTTLDDPSIAQLGGEDPLALSATPEAPGPQTSREQIATGLASYYGNQIAAQVGDVLGGTRISFRPILVFGEADPTARLTVERPFSPSFSLAASIDLREAESQTYILDAHDLKGLPSLKGQVFTTDRGNEGAIVQQRLEFPRQRRSGVTTARIRRLELDLPPGVSRRSARKALDLRKGDHLPATGLFAAEVALTEHLRQRGYPDARVELEAVPVEGKPHRAVLSGAIAPGPKVAFEFSGERLSRAFRDSITSLYRTDFYEPVAIAEMNQQAVRALRFQGFLHPDVSIQVEPQADPDSKVERTVMIHSTGGRRVELEHLVVGGLPPEEAVEVASRFSTPVQRVELAAGVESAEQRLLSAIRTLGYTDPRLLDREISDEGKRLTVEVSAGEVRRLDGIEIEGVDEVVAERLLSSMSLKTGDPVDTQRIALGAVEMERQLRSDGFRNARVEARLDRDSNVEPAAVVLTYSADTRQRAALRETRFEGLRFTRAGWASSVAGLETGQLLNTESLSTARRNLYESGLFSSVLTREENRNVDQTDVVFEVAEVPRFNVAYGARWESDEGATAIVNAADQNFLGRAVTLALQALYKQDDQSVRLNSILPRLVGSPAYLEVFASYRERVDEGFDEEITQSSLQLSYPFRNGLVARVYGRYRDSWLRELESDDPFFPPLEFHFRTPVIGLQSILDRRNDELILTRGWLASVDLSGTGEFLDSDFKYVRFFGQLNTFRPAGRLLGRRLTWAQSVRFGLADSFEQEMDRNDRFFAGGEYSVRGYPTDTLGPVEILGEVTRPLGGEAIFVLNEELRFSILEPVAGLVFFDAGNVWEAMSTMDTELFKSLGLGLRAITPVGLLRLDFALPLDRRDDDPSYKLYFGFGSTF